MGSESLLRSGGSGGLGWLELTSKPIDDGDDGGELT
jgi:hypothetical protein